MIMMAGGGEVGGRRLERAEGLRPEKRAVSGCSRLSEVDTDNGLSDMPGLILSPPRTRSQSILRVDQWDEVTV